MERRLLRNYLPSKGDTSESGGLLPFCPAFMDRQLNNVQTSQGQLLNNFISGSAGGLVGTVLNTPYVRQFSPLYSNANSLLSLLPVSTSAAEFIEYIVAVRAHTLHTGCQVSHPGSRESTRFCPEVQLDIPCVCLHVKITCCDR